MITRRNWSRLKMGRSRFRWQLKVKRTCFTRYDFELLRTDAGITGCNMAAGKEDL